MNKIKANRNLIFQHDSNCFWHKRKTQTESLLHWYTRYKPVRNSIYILQVFFPVGPIIDDIYWIWTSRQFSIQVIGVPSYMSFSSITYWIWNSRHFMIIPWVSFPIWPLLSLCGWSRPLNLLVLVDIFYNSWTFCSFIRF